MPNIIPPPIIPSNMPLSPVFALLAAARFALWLRNLLDEIRSFPIAGAAGNVRLGDYSATLPVFICNDCPPDLPLLHLVAAGRHVLIRRRRQDVCGHDLRDWGIDSLPLGYGAAADIAIGDDPHWLSHIIDNRYGPNRFLCHDMRSIPNGIGAAAAGWVTAHDFLNLHRCSP
ncbi:hypothetical protein GGR20_000003 [Devosia subaequoris]|uniref:Uncharacterized protein n=1 Tax=Devosia subaequoris TaxID=395930 RepID=A0A7W6IIR6_9HYPH|nr:hypothetical protein [Devosia subaequoris]